MRLHSLADLRVRREALVPAPGKPVEDYSFDLVAYKWVLSDKVPGARALAEAYERPSALVEYFGMNGTEL